MSRIAFINCGDNGSTGQICLSLMNAAKKQGHHVLFAAHYLSDKHALDAGFWAISENSLSYQWNKVLCRLDGSDGFRNKAATKRLIHHLRVFNPDIVHLHNLHGHYINMPLLFDFFAATKTKVVWTMHDCWPFTGRCPHFESAGCDAWRDGCKKCPKSALRDYPAAYVFNRPGIYHSQKTTMVEQIRNQIVFVSPSRWLLNLFEQSKLSKLPHRLIHNGIEPAETRFDYTFISSLKLDSRKTVLFAAAYPFVAAKGIDYVIRLSKELDYSRFELVVAGLVPSQEKQLSPETKSVGVVRDPSIMFSLLSCADCFLNPTLQDNFPTINIESLQAGTPVLTFDTGGSSEMLSPKTGFVVPKGNYDELFSRIASLTKKTEAPRDACRNRASEFASKKMTNEYLKLYSEILDHN